MRRAFSLLLGTVCLVAVVLLPGSVPRIQPDRPSLPDPTRPRELPGEAAALNVVAQNPGKDLKPERLAEGLNPPTNRWFSGLVFGPEPLPVYPLPLSFQLTATGFNFGLPEVQSTEKTLFGGHRPEVSVTVPGITGWQVVAYDTATVVVEARGADGPVGRVTLAQGSPQVTFTASSAVTLETSSLPEHFGMVPESGSGATQIAEGQSVTWVAIPDGASKAEVLGQVHPVTGSALSWQVDDEKTFTTITWQTADGAPTLVATMPHQTESDTDQDCRLGTFKSVYGELKACLRSSVTWGAPKLPAPATYDLGKLDEAGRANLITHLETDVQHLPAYPADTYFAGKALARDAQLLQLAKTLGRDDLAATIRNRLVPEMRTWTNPAGCATPGAARCFFYDQNNHGVVGLVATFGSDEFNDHHFHYGYFLYAAALVAMDDPNLVSEMAPVMTLLSSDIARPVASDRFPALRVYDAYASHSWASGTSPFADANNQESTSEAVAAWVGLRLWGEVSGDQAMADQGTWMQSNEANAALAYWLNFNKSDPLYAPLEYSYLPLNFGGKRDFATWFSPDPEAGLAIQVLPVTPASTYLGRDPDRVATNIDNALTADTFSRTYGDILLAYSALAGEEARAKALTLVDEVPSDDGFTRSLLLAWLYSLKA